MFNENKSENINTNNISELCIFYFISRIKLFYIGLNLELFFLNVKHN